MKYRLFAAAAVALLASACDFKGNVYSMTPQQAYDKLVAAPIERSGKGPFGKLDVSASGDGSATVRWGTGYGEALCEANIAPEGADKSRIMAYCGSGGEGAAAGMFQALIRKAVIEHIDSALKGRPYDFKAGQGATAALWPDDPRQADGSIGAASTEALKMERETHQMINDADKLEAEMAAKAAQRTEGVTFKPGQPMIDPSK